MTLKDQAISRGVAVPTQRTLDRYGLTASAWIRLLANQGWQCAVCHRDTWKYNTDHEHVPGWSKMPPKERSIYVRGVLCWHCNRRVVPSNLSAADSRRVAEYLEAYEKRRDKRRNR